MSENRHMGKGRSCFVIMPFGGMWDQYYSQIYGPAIEKAMLLPVRADEVFRAGSILQDVVGLLSKAAIVLADITENNRNVHYELGLAHALGKPTVLVAPVGMPSFFDVGQERMLTYDKDHAFWGMELRDALARTLEETMRAPETAIPTAFMHIKPDRIETDEVIVRLRRIEEQLTEIARVGRGQPGFQSLFVDTLRSLPAAEADADRLLRGGAGQEEAIRRLMMEGYKEAMADAAVVAALARIRREGRNRPDTPIQPTGSAGG